jgi:hypothetical protein
VLSNCAFFDERFDGIEIPSARGVEQVAVNVPGWQCRSRRENQTG